MKEKGKRRRWHLEFFVYRGRKTSKGGERDPSKSRKNHPPGKVAWFGLNRGIEIIIKSVLHPFWEIVEIFGRTQIFGGQLEVRSLCSEKNGHFAAPVLRN